MDLKSLRCFQHLDWSPDAASLRRFAISMLVGFAVIGGIAYLRTHSLRTAGIFAAIGTALALLAVIPGVGRIVYLAIYLPTSVIGFLISQVLLSLVFFAVVTPIALLLRLLGKDLLQIRAGSAKSLWVDHRRKMDPRSYYRQF